MKKNKRIEEKLLLNVNKLLKHRGPDEQNFKTFDTRDKALKHIRATKYPLNEGIDLDTAYNSQNKKIVQNRLKN
mgnify:CR=1 FL=1